MHIMHIVMMHVCAQVHFELTLIKIAVLHNWQFFFFSSLPVLLSYSVGSYSFVFM